jgi:hypothetical protein
MRQSCWLLFKSFNLFSAMLKLAITFVAWAALGYPIYKFIAPWALVAYGVVSLLALLIWAGTRKGSTIKRNV